MAVLNDYQCKSCGKVYPDSLGKPEESCCGEWEITFQNWKGFNFQRDYSSSSDTHTTHGVRRKFKASEDPLVQYELGLIPDHGIKSFSPDQSAHYAEKMMKDGDTPALRREILRERQRTQTAEGFSTQEVE